LQTGTRCNPPDGQDSTQHTKDLFVQTPILLLLLLLLLLGGYPYDILQRYCKAGKNPCMTR
jgi:hypothetical protein